MPRACGPSMHLRSNHNCMRSSMPIRLKQRVRHADGRLVIELNRIHGNGTFFVNPDLIETVEARPDTVVSLVNKHRYVVADTVAEIVDRIVEFRANVVRHSGVGEDIPSSTRVLTALDDTEEEQAA